MIHRNSKVCLGGLTWQKMRVGKMLGLAAERCDLPARSLSVFLQEQQRGESLCCPVCCTSHHPSEEPGNFSHPKNNCAWEESLADCGWGEEVVGSQ